jgi:uroporphyrinogen III methyltransferase/synthase
VIDWDAVARGAGTLVLYMSVSHLPDVVRQLRAAGRRGDEPVAVVEQGTLPEQRTIVGTLDDIVAKAAGVKPPALTIVGEVVKLRGKISWFDGRPLHGRRVLLLATSDEVDLGDTRGASVTRISPLQVVHRFAEVKQALAQLAELRGVAFTSVHGVEAFFSALRAIGRDARALAGLKLCAVGSTTARRLEELGISPDLTAAGGGQALGDEIAAAGFPGPFLVPRAREGRDDLIDRLAQASIEVRAIDAYETVPDDAALARAAREHRARPFDAVGFASPKGARVFLEVLGRPPDTVVGAIGETTRAALGEAGVTAHVMPERPGLAALLAALLDALAKA